MAGVPRLGGVVLGGTLLLGGCGDAGESRSAVQEMESHADGVIDGVVREIAEVAGVAFTRGTRTFAVCGESYAPRGVALSNRLAFTTSELSEEQVLVAAAGLLVDDGWQVTELTDPAALIGTRRVGSESSDGELSIRIELGAAALLLEIDATCVETAGDVAREYDDRPGSRIDWSRSEP